MINSYNDKYVRYVVYVCSVNQGKLKNVIMKLFSKNTSKRELTFVNIKNILHIGSENNRIVGKKIFVDIFKKWSFDITIYKEGINENNGQRKAYFDYDKTKDAMGYSVDLKIPFVFIMFRSHIV